MIIGSSLRYCACLGLVAAVLVTGLHPQRAIAAESASTGAEPTVILRGDYPDPTILRDGEDYYLTHSPFLYTPGFLIWHSRDLVHWEPVCRAMTKVVGSAMAPDLVKHRGKYYIYFPAAGVNWVIWADHIRGPWSDPIKLNVGQIDPGHVVDEKGQRWLFLSDGYRIRLADDGLSVIGQKEKVYSGWDYPAAWKTEGKYLEAPKLIRKNGWFYLISAEGGTAGPATSHMVIVARARNLEGPWENSPYNPVVHTWSAGEHWWSKGHGTLVDDGHDHWWIVYHAYENGAYPLGRQTLIEPVQWTADGWIEAASGAPRLPDGVQQMPLSDDFAGSTLGPQWTTWREYTPADITLKNHSLYLRAKGTNPADGRLLLTTATDSAYSIETEVTLAPGGIGGLVLFYSEKAFVGIVYDGGSFTVYEDAQRRTRHDGFPGGHGFVKIVNDGRTCAVLASRDGLAWNTVHSGIGISEMHHNRCKGFFALRPGLIAAGVGEVRFDHFRYVPTLVSAPGVVADAPVVPPNEVRAPVPSAVSVPVAEPLREHLSLDANWKFHLGDDWPRTLDLSKAGASTGPAAETFHDESWRALSLPHDWAVELPFEKSADRNHGFKPIGPGFPANNIGWYRRVFELPKEDESKRIGLAFDGVFRDATVWVNGWLVARHESGYYPFHADITDIVRFGGRNVVTVRVDASEPEGWFYEGAGIYRHVWLEKTAPIAVAPDGIFVRSEFADNLPIGAAEIKVDVAVVNALGNAVNPMVSCVVVTPAGKTLPAFSDRAQIERDSTRTVSLKSVVSEPSLWSPESPSLYTLITTISVGGKVVDREESLFGIRTVAFDKERGFLLNGRLYAIKGTCNHQDHAGVGVALPDALQSFRIARLKEMGSNAYRTSHNPPTPELLDACDRLGMIVMDENRLLGSDAENVRKWEDQVRRDRNHPSVCIWSIANEEFSVQSTPQGANAARTLQNRVKHLDPTRPVTYAAPQGDAFNGINGVIDVRGWNYHVGGEMDKYHAAHPEQPNVGTEQASVVGTRGVYEDSASRGYVRAYDDRGKDTAESWWSYFAVRPWLSGAFVWTGFDYRGEPTPFGWPCISSHFGTLDTCGFPKDSFYYYQSWWGSDVVLHLLPHWNWQGKEGQEIHVDALSNCREVELFLNGASVGRQVMQPNSKLTWKVKYAQGVLSAKGFDATGKMIAETKVETTGEPVAVKLTRDLTGLSEVLKADGEDVAVFTVSAVDAQGRTVPTAQNQIVFNLEGAGRIIGVGNGDPSCHEPDVFVPPVPRMLPVAGWRWKIEAFPTRSDPSARVLNANVDESGWNEAKALTNATVGDLPLYEGRTAVYRAHITLTEGDLSAPALRLLFNGCNRNGWYFVNGQLVGESHKWEERPSFDVTQYLHAGDNIIAVGVRHGGTYGGLNPNVNLEIGAKATAVQWSRSLFNGLAQIIVQSAKTAGKLNLTAAADGLKPVTVTLETRASPLRPFVP